MVNRREFIQHSVAGVVLAGAMPIRSSAAATRHSAMPIDKVIFDERFADCLSFAIAASRLGATVQSIRGDISAIWYHDLYYRWKQASGAIAGLTTHRSLFCLDMFARDAGLRVVHYADHRFRSDGSVDHQVFGLQGVQQTIRLKRAPNWSAEAANLAMRLPAQSQPVGKRADPLIAPASPQPLVSWVIAPLHRV